MRITKLACSVAIGLVLLAMLATPQPNTSAAVFNSQPTPTPTTCEGCRMDCWETGLANYRICMSWLNDDDVCCGQFWAAFEECRISTCSPCDLKKPDCPSGVPAPCKAQGEDCTLNSQCCENFCNSQNKCAQPPASPIVVDANGDGFNLTAFNDGVTFDLDSDGVRERLAWTARDSDDAWLALDRNNNNSIDNGQELFGNFTPQPVAENPNGFLALAEYDRSASGGNEDKWITNADPVFNSLRLWQDVNHNGVSELSELHTLPVLGINSIPLEYKEVMRRDRHGNLFRYRAGRRFYDVFLLAQ